MKKNDTHPKYYEATEVTCSCGAKFIVGSTKEKLETELCSQCHPFYTGQQKFVDTAGRVDKFKKQQEAAKKKQEALAVKSPKKRKKTMEDKFNEKLDKHLKKEEEKE